MKNTNLQNQYNGTNIKMDGTYIAQLNNKWGISRIDMSIRLMEKYLLHGKQKFLDIGCGDVELCQKVENSFDEAYGIDIVEERVKGFYDKHQNSTLKLSIQDLNGKLNFDDNSFNCITSLVTLDWVYDINNAIREINRILKDDGIFILEVNNLGYLPRRLKLLCGNYPKISAFSRSEWGKIGWDANVCHVFVEKELTTFLQEFGFEILEVAGSGIFYKWRSWWAGLLCGDLFYVCKKK